MLDYWLKNSLDETQCKLNKPFVYLDSASYLGGGKAVKRWANESLCVQNSDVFWYQILL